MVGSISPNSLYEATVNDVCFGVKTGCELTHCGIIRISAVRTDFEPTQQGAWFFYSNDPASDFFQYGTGDSGVPNTVLVPFVGTEADFELKFCQNLQKLNFCTS